MSSDKIAEIRARHKEGIRAGAGGQAMSEEYAHEPLEVAEGILSGKYTLTSVYVLVNQIEDLTHERNEARKESDRLYTECEQLWDEYKKMYEVIRTIGARCVELDDSEAVSAILDAILDITENILKKDKQ